MFENHIQNNCNTVKKKEQDGSSLRSPRYLQDTPPLSIIVVQTISPGRPTLWLPSPLSLKQPFLYSINQRNIKKILIKKSSKCIKNVRKINLMIA